MSRSGYSDDCDGTIGLYRHAVDVAIAGKRGQRLLLDMVVALDAMPIRELAADVFVSGEYMCAMGAVARARAIDEDRLARFDYEDPGEVGKLLDIPRSLAAEIAYENDEWCRGDDEDRWEHMRKWAASHIVERKARRLGRCSWCCRVFTLRRGVINWHDKGRCPGVARPPFVPPL
jgi:hypothetical protein